MTLAKIDDWNDPGKVYAALCACDEPSLGPLVERSLRILTDAMRIFGVDAVYASFNGGKDAVVILHLLRGAAYGLKSKHSIEKRPHLVYFDSPGEFDQVRTFVSETCAALDQEFDLDILELGFVPGLTQLVNKRSPLAFVLGTRQGDPNSGGQEHFEPSSDWMPPFMRVNPILEWSYGDVWHFLRYFNFPYCSLYDEGNLFFCTVVIIIKSIITLAGYTSLGSQQSTFQNPALRKEDGTYLPAFELSDWSLERAGRIEASSSRTVRSPGKPPAASQKKVAEDPVEPLS